MTSNSRTSMSEAPKKVAEIAVILGIPESEVREIAKEYEVILPGKKIGKVAVYEDSVVDRFRKVADLRAQGLPHEVIVPAIRGGKSLEERAMEDMKKMGIAVPKEEPKEAPKPIPRTETEEELILAVRSMEAKVVSMDHRFAALRDKNEEDMEKFSDAVASLSADIASLKDQMFTLWDQIASLESFLREQSKENNKPFWKR